MSEVTQQVDEQATQTKDETETAELRERVKLLEKELRLLRTHLRRLNINPSFEFLLAHYEE